MYPLTLARIGEEVIVDRIGGKPEVKKQLENLGFVQGTPITIIQALGGGLIVKVKDARVALNREMVGKIMINGGQK